jgi:hypothetical protein
MIVSAVPVVVAVLAVMVVPVGAGRREEAPRTSSLEMAMPTGSFADNRRFSRVSMLPVIATS